MLAQQGPNGLDVFGMPDRFSILGTGGTSQPLFSAFPDFVANAGVGFQHFSHVLRPGQEFAVQCLLLQMSTL